MLSRKVQLAGAAVFSATLALCLLRKVVDFDLWYHLLIGKQIVRTGHIPATEFYVYPALGTASGFHEWGFGVLAYVTQRAVGWWGLSALVALVCSSAVMAVAGAAARRGASWSAILPAAAALALACEYRFLYRPEIVLYASIAATLYLIERRWWPALPVVTFLLSLFHPSALLVILAAACLALDALRDRPTRKGVAVVMGSLAAAIVAVLLTPHGVEQLTLPLQFARQRQYLSTIAEFAPTWESARRWQFLAVAIAAIAGLAFTPRRRSSDVLLVSGFGLLAFLHMRNIPLLAIVAYGPAALALSRIALRIPRVARRAGAALSTAALLLAVASTPAWGAGEMPGRAPTLTADFIEQYHPRGRILNQLHTGGYLAWRLFPSYLVAADGRAYYGTNEPLRFIDSVFEVQPGWREALRDHGVTMISTPGVRLSSGALVPLVAELDADPEWSLVVTEPAGMLFVRRDALPAGAEVIPKADIWRQVLAESDAVMQAEVLALSPRALFSRGVALFKLHDFTRAEQALARYAQLAPQDTEAAQFTQLLEAGLAGDPAARAAVEEMYRRGRGL